MEPLYPITGHVMLSAATSALTAELLALHTVIAEETLGLAGTEFTDQDDIDKATLANVLQVNYALTLPDDIGYVKSETRGKRSVTYRDSVLPLVDAHAQLLADALLATTDEGSWQPFGPRR